MAKLRQEKLPPKRAKVLEAVETLNYKPSITARRLRNAEDTKPTIALYWPLDHRTTFLGSILMGIQNEIKRLNYHCDVVVCTYLNDELYKEYDLFKKNNYSAAIIGATSLKDMEFLESIKPHIPTVLFNRYSDKYSTVCTDNYDSAYKAAKLIAAKGHERVSIFTAESPYLAMNIRTESFIEACNKLGIKTEERFILQVENSYEGGAIAARKFVGMKNRPGALFCSSDFSLGCFLCIQQGENQNTRGLGNRSNRHVGPQDYRVQHPANYRCVNPRKGNGLGMHEHSLQHS